MSRGKEGGGGKRSVEGKERQNYKMYTDVQATRKGKGDYYLVVP